jgi:hypothetical protein
MYDTNYDKSAKNGGPPLRPLLRIKKRFILASNLAFHTPVKHFGILPPQYLTYFFPLAYPS